MSVRNINDDNTLAYLLNKNSKETDTKVSKSGDTMTGDLWLNANLFRNSTLESRIGQDVPAADQFDVGEQIYDKNGRRIYYSQMTRQTSDQLYRSFVVCRRSADGNTEYRNGFYLRINNSGTPLVTFYDTASKNAWLSGLGLTTTSTTTASSIITPATGITINSASYAQCGNIASIMISWKSSSTISVNADGNATNVTVGTIVSGKRPKIDTAGTSFGDNGGPAFYILNPSGTLTLGACGGTGASRTVAANTVFWASFTYILP